MAIPLPESLWAKIDNYLQAALIPWAEQFNELIDTDNNAHVEIGEEFDPGDVPVPFILIRSYERKMAEGEPQFGDGEFHIANIVYEYEILLFNLFDTVALAKNFCSNAMAECIEFLRADVTMGGLAADSGEYILQFEFGDHEIYVRGLAGQESGRYAGVACVRFNVTTEV